MAYSTRHELLNYFKNGEMYTDSNENTNINTNRNSIDKLNASNIKTIQDLDKDTIANKDSSVDIMIRTSGETRLSDYMVEHCKHAKFVFVDVNWPVFGKWLGWIVFKWQIQRRVKQWIYQ